MIPKKSENQKQIPLFTIIVLTYSLRKSARLEAKNHVAREYNSTQALLCWLIGKRIDEEVLKSERAEYGETTVASLSTYLTHSYGKGYSDQTYLE
ncbi:MAG: DUF1016 N-terminal domain-containing protein [Legionella sp.]